MRVARVFPRKTKATPTDEEAFVGEPTLFVEADKVHISVAFTYDLPLAEKLAQSWKYVAPVEIGGPATGMRGEDFIPGRYLKEGRVITSRGCPNRCWFCSVWRREGESVRELPIRDGWNVLDDNLLACSENHIQAVFSMLQKYRGKCEFTGGLEAARLTPKIAEQLHNLRPAQLFFAYDTENDLEPLINAGTLLKSAGFSARSHNVRCYVLCGYPKDTFDAAEKRMYQAVGAGFYPMAMLYRDNQGLVNKQWSVWQRLWARPAIIAARLKQNASEGLKSTPGANQ